MKYKLDNIINMTLVDKETGKPIWSNDQVENVTLDDEDEDVRFYGKPELGSPVTIEGKINDETIIKISGLYGGHCE